MIVSTVIYFCYEKLHCDGKDEVCALSLNKKTPHNATILEEIDRFITGFFIYISFASMTYRMIRCWYDYYQIITQIPLMISLNPSEQHQRPSVQFWS